MTTVRLALLTLSTALLLATGCGGGETRVIIVTATPEPSPTPTITPMPTPTLTNLQQAEEAVRRGMREAISSRAAYKVLCDRIEGLSREEAGRRWYTLIGIEEDALLSQFGVMLKEECAAASPP